MRKKETNLEINNKLYETILHILQNTNNVISDGKSLTEILSEMKKRFDAGDYPDTNSVLDLLARFLENDGIPNEIRKIILSVKDMQTNPKQIK